MKKWVTLVLACVLLSLACVPLACLSLPLSGWSRPVAGSPLPLYGAVAAQAEALAPAGPLVWTQADRYRTYYEIFVGSYCDSNGDGIGDLNGITAHMEDIAGLGVSGLWLMPIMPSPSYHKYDVTDYYAIDEAYGTMEDFKALLAAAKEKDIAVIIDLVLNHTSKEHPWFLSAAQSIASPDCGGETCAYEALCRRHNPYCGYYHFSQDPGASMHSLDNGWYYEGAFGDHMPDLNLGDQAVVKEIDQIAAFYLNLGVYGFRLDAVMHFEEGNTGFNNAFVRHLTKLFPKAYFVGEVWADAGTIAAYYDSGIDSIFNYPFATQTGAIFGAVKSGKGAALAAKVQSWQETLRAASADAVDAPFLSNHDNGRSAGYVQRNTAKERLMARAYLLMPGAPFIYYGEELGMTGSGRDENKRLPYLWSAVALEGMPLPPEGADQEQRLTEGYDVQDGDPASLLNAYREVLAARKALPQIAEGSAEAVDLGDAAVYATVHQGATGGVAKETVLVVHNFSSEEAAVDLKAALGAGWQMTYALGNEAGAPALDGTQLHLPGLTSAILTR